MSETIIMASRNEDLSDTSAEFHAAVKTANEDFTSKPDNDELLKV